MPKIIPIAQQKSDARRTNVAAHLAVSLSQTGKRVTIILNRLDIFQNYFGNRGAFSSCFLTDITATESYPSSQAAAKVRAFTEKIIELFEKNQVKGIEKSTSLEKRSIAKT